MTEIILTIAVWCGPAEYVMTRREIILRPEVQECRKKLFGCVSERRPKKSFEECIAKELK